MRAFHSVLLISFCAAALSACAHEDRAFPGGDVQSAPPVFRPAPPMPIELDMTIPEKIDQRRECAQSGKIDCGKAAVTGMRPLPSAQAP